jgi:transmembrane sensor
MRLAGSELSGPPGRPPVPPVPDEPPAPRDFDSLYRATIAPLRRYLARLLGNTTEAQDVAHDAYLRTYSNLTRPETQSPEGLLYTTARRLAINRLKRRSVAPFSNEAVKLETAAASTPGVAQQVMPEQELELLQRAIAELTKGLPHRAFVTQSRTPFPPRNRRASRHCDQHRRKTTRPRAAPAARLVPPRIARRRLSRPGQRPGGQLMNTLPHHAAAEEQASLWAALLEGYTLTAEDRLAIDAWLAAHPTHRALLSAYCQFSTDLEKTLPALVEVGAVAMPAEPAPRRRNAWSYASWFVGGAVTAAAAAAIVWMAWPAAQVDCIAVPAGQRQTVALADGTRVELNARTSLTAEISKTERRARLADGQAYFTVSKDPSRPFIVETPAGSVRVTGTVFGVRTEFPAQLEVIVTEGSVQVRPGQDGAAPIPLTTGDRLTVTNGAPTKVEKLTRSDLEDALAWREGKIVFVDVPVRGARLELPDARSTVTTDDRGEFDFPAVSPGTYGLVARARGFPPQTWPGVKIDTDRATELGALTLQSAGAPALLSPFVVECKRVRSADFDPSSVPLPPRSPSPRPHSPRSRSAIPRSPTPECSGASPPTPTPSSPAATAAPSSPRPTMAAHGRPGSPATARGSSRSRMAVASSSSSVRPAAFSRRTTASRGPTSPAPAPPSG